MLPLPHSAGNRPRRSCKVKSMVLRLTSGVLGQYCTRCWLGNLHSVEGIRCGLAFRIRFLQGQQWSHNSHHRSLFSNKIKNIVLCWDIERNETRFRTASLPSRSLAVRARSSCWPTSAEARRHPLAKVSTLFQRMFPHRDARAASCCSDCLCQTRSTALLSENFSKVMFWRGLLLPMPSIAPVLRLFPVRLRRATRVGIWLTVLGLMEGIREPLVETLQMSESSIQATGSSRSKSSAFL